MTTPAFARWVAGLAAAAFLALGVWAFVAPRSFYDEVATFPPFNEHLLHDLGAFQVGLGVVLVLALLGWPSLVTALGGVAAGSVLHSVAHVMDRDKGGRDSDPVALAVVAILLVVGAAAAWLALRRQREAS